VARAAHRARWRRGIGVAQRRAGDPTGDCDEGCSLLDDLVARSLATVRAALNAPSILPIPPTLSILRTRRFQWLIRGRYLALG
jgi:hypothetical protein